MTDRENSPEAARTGGEGERASFPSGCCWVCSEDQVSAESSVGQGDCHRRWVGLVCRGAAPLSAPASRGEAEQQDFEPKPRPLRANPEAGLPSSGLSACRKRL